MGLRDLGCLNHALLAKVAWRIFKIPDSLLSQCYWGSFVSIKEFLEVMPVSCSTWESILSGKELLCKGLKWNIGDGERISVFHDEWIPNVCNPYRGCLIIQRSQMWREPLISVLFPREVAQNLMSLCFPSSNMEDDLLREHTKDGVFPG